MNTILVTALIDIGRGNWSNQWKRDFSEYLCNFRNVCGLHNFMVIWVTEDLVNTVEEFRRGKEAITSIRVCTLEDYVLYKYRNRFEEILSYNRTRDWCHQNASNAIEYTIPLYDVVVNNKVEFVRKSRELQCFGEGLDSYYAWIDAGLTNSTIDFTDRSINLNKDAPDPVYITRLWRWPFETDWKKFQEMHWPLDVVAGGFVAYRGSIIEEFSEKYYTLIDESINQKVLDDDQFYMTMLYVRHPSLFCMSQGDWFDGVHRYLE